MGLYKCYLCNGLLSIEVRTNGDVLIYPCEKCARKRMEIIKDFIYSSYLNTYKDLTAELNKKNL